MFTNLSVSRRLIRTFTLLSGLSVLTVFPRVLAADDCGCLETCRRNFGGLRYAKGTLMLLSSCWIADGDTYCVYQEWQ